MAKNSTLNERPRAPTPRSLRGLAPFIRPYRRQVSAALLFLVLAAGATLMVPVAMRQLIDELPTPVLAFCRSGARSTRLFQQAVAG